MILLLGLIGIVFYKKKINSEMINLEMTWSRMEYLFQYHPMIASINGWKEVTCIEVNFCNTIESLKRIGNNLFHDSKFLNGGSYQYPKKNEEFT